MQRQMFMDAPDQHVVDEIMSDSDAEALLLPPRAHPPAKNVSAEDNSPSHADKGGVIVDKLADDAG